MVGTLAVELTEEWHLTRRYVSKESLAKVLAPMPAESRLGAQEAAYPQRPGIGKSHELTGRYPDKRGNRKPVDV